MASETPVPGSSAAAEPAARVVEAGALDIRNFIAALVGLYGAVLTVRDLFAFGAEEAARTGGVDANLWTGVAVVASALLCAGWAKADPLRIPGPGDRRGSPRARRPLTAPPPVAQ